MKTFTLYIKGVQPFEVVLKQALKAMDWEAKHREMLAFDTIDGILLVSLSEFIALVPEETQE